MMIRTFQPRVHFGSTSNDAIGIWHLTVENMKDILRALEHSKYDTVEECQTLIQAIHSIENQLEGK